MTMADLHAQLSATRTRESALQLQASQLQTRVDDQTTTMAAKHAALLETQAAAGRVGEEDLRLLVGRLQDQLAESQERCDEAEAELRRAQQQAARDADAHVSFVNRAREERVVFDRERDQRCAEAVESAEAAARSTVMDVQRQVRVKVKFTVKFGVGGRAESSAAAYGELDRERDSHEWSSSALSRGTWKLKKSLLLLVIHAGVD